MVYGFWNIFYKKLKIQKNIIYENCIKINFLQQKKQRKHLHKVYISGIYNLAA